MCSENSLRPSLLTCFSGIHVFVQLCLWSLTFFKCASLRQRPNSSGRAIHLISRVNRESFAVAFLACCKLESSVLARNSLNDSSAVVPGSVIADGIWTDFATQITKMTYIAFPYVDRFDRFVVFRGLTYTTEHS